MDSTEPEDHTPSRAFQVPPGALNTGAPTRQWLNEHVTPTLLEGMRLIAQEKPEDPLKFLGEFLISKSPNNNAAANHEAPSTINTSI